ncbi:unnamed protein product [Adineta ricciae]|uniref:Uncharacterized protein n=1 Tax=Adineta ricciae TaxID=249248 RepID=A0A815GVP1_ADIRI|nr:unnamed protein product [Adineta ricciae]CAF1562773.1 unnamed protein product [Adineta ricciae]
MSVSNSVPHRFAVPRRVPNATYTYARPTIVSVPQPLQPPLTRIAYINILPRAVPSVHSPPELSVSPTLSISKEAFIAKDGLSETDSFWTRCYAKCGLFCCMPWCWTISAVILGGAIGTIIFFALQNTATVTTGTPTTTISKTTIYVPSPILNNTCTSVVSDSPTVLVYLTNSTSFSYTFYQYTYVAASTMTTMMLAMRQNPSYWCLDDISVTYNGVQMWQNGGFELSPLTKYYTYCNPNGAASSGSISPSCPRSGSYSFKDGSVTYSDYISQSFSTVVGGMYNISFWLSNLGAPTNSFIIIIG